MHSHSASLLTLAPRIVDADSEAYVSLILSAHQAGSFPVELPKTVFSQKPTDGDIYRGIPNPLAFKPMEILFNIFFNMISHFLLAGEFRQIKYVFLNYV